MSDFPKCPNCIHSWHGLECPADWCECETSCAHLFKPKDE